MNPKKQIKQEEISTDWDLNLNEGWGEDLITDWDIELTDWEIDLSGWDIQLSEGWNNATDKTDTKQAESLDSIE